MKTYNQNNFFKHTFCEFQQADHFTFPENPHYKSKSESSYFYTDEGVYRKSNHWGRVANCRWKIIANEHYKNQQIVIGFAKWTHFYPMNSSEKIFYIDVDFKSKTAKLQPKINNPSQYLFTFSEAQKRTQQIQHLFKDDKWAKHYDLEITELRFQIISDFIKFNKTLQEIKRNFH
ncbi:hypothetical protein K8354_01605 [Polaribacter litorisediminis]|uniref:hypothetical protein n=1 Tax=Polaribacter litorisediminis TaxID=1908341 RepID=UPI001CBDFB23|nr:hypothetical protein [Polaribacter litorisediminis]UAM98550.1 hypothetical protein K8354_01605 [Polaribacter litorisediminis]